MAGYTRNDVTDQIANGNTVDAIPLDGEFNAIQGAFASSGGHKHDGSTGEGAPITTIGPTQDVVASANSLTPKTDNAIDLGSATFEWKDLYIDGVANIDSLVADTADINAGTIDGTVIGGSSAAAITGTTVTATNLVATNATVGGVAVTTLSNTQTLTNKTINLANNTLVATSAQLAASVSDETGSGALVFAASPTLSGVPTAPTAAANTNTTQIATTAHVFAERSNTATLTNKTLTSPAINTATITGGTVSGITDLAIADGGTGASTAANALINFGLTATAAELNTLDGITASSAELNILDGANPIISPALLANPQRYLDPENRIINGAFDFWQRGTSQTTPNYGSADRWQNAAIGGTVTMSRQSFTVGDTLGSNSPAFFLRQTVSGQTLASHVANITQRIEGVRSYAGQTITVLGWARRSSGAGNMAVDGFQLFGSGGSPSAFVLLTPQTVVLTGSFAPFAVTFSVPSITGKTLGTNGDDYVGLRFWTSAGADLNSQTNSLGLQTIGVDLWGVHIKLGTHTVDAVNLYKQPELGPELARCQRYYETGNAGFTTYQLNTTGFGSAVIFAVQKRSTPTIAFSSTTFLNASTISAGILTASCVEILAVAATNGTAQYRTQFTADAEL